MQKISFKCTPEAWEHNQTRLTNQIFKLLPMLENGEDWEKQHETILLELKGYNDIFAADPEFMVLVGKMQSLHHTEDQFSFRKIIFECLAVLKEIKV